MSEYKPFQQIVDYIKEQQRIAALPLWKRFLRNFGAKF